MSYSVSPRGLALIRKFEGFRAVPAPLPGGGWLVGYGHVRIGAAGARVTKTEAAELLALDAAPVERVVNRALTVAVVQSQFDALVSFAFSIGEAAFLASDVLREVNAGNSVAAARAMDGDAVGEFAQALALRRAAEKAMFLKDAPGAAAPSALVRSRRGPERLTAILRAEPATEALLLTQLAPQSGERELACAHAAPVARKRRARFPRFDVCAVGENFGLAALLMFGGALLAGGSSMVIGGDGVDLLAGAALASPGLAAIAMAGYGLWRGGQRVKSAET